MNENIDLLMTEQNNPSTRQIDQFEIRQILELINREDQTVPLAVARELDDITKAVEAAKQKLLVSCRLKDVFCDPSGEKLAADRKAMTYTFLYRDAKKTLTAAEVDAAHQTVLDALAKGVSGLNFR